MPTLLTDIEIAALATAGKFYPLGGPWEPWCKSTDMACVAPAVRVLPYDRATVIGWASEILYGLTGHMFPGRAKDTIRAFFPHQPDACVRTVPYECNCNTYPTSTLAYRWPIVDVYSVAATTTGTAIDPGAWEFLAPNTLVRTDGAYWPCCGVTVVAAVGNPPTSLAVKACAELACALEKVDVGENECIPAGAKSWTGPAGSIDLNEIRIALAEGKYIRMPFVAQLLTLYPRDKMHNVDVWSLDLEDA